jgi:hypothetical protein
MASHSDHSEHNEYSDNQSNRSDYSSAAVVARSTDIWRRCFQFEHDVDVDAPVWVDGERARRSSSTDVTRWDDDMPDSALKIYDRDHMNTRLRDMIDEVRKVLEVCVRALCSQQNEHRSTKRCAATFS